MIFTSNLDSSRMWAAKELHEKSGFDYRFPPLQVDVGKGLQRNPLFPVQRCVMDGKRFIAAAALKVEAETYFWLDANYGVPQDRLAVVARVQSDLIDQGRKIGFDSLYCVLPPEIAKGFGSRLQDLGWVLSRPWPKYTLELRKPEPCAAP